MKESFCLVILLCIYMVVNGEVCISPDDTKDIQLMPGCSLKNLVNKAVGHFQKYLTSYPAFPDQSVCGKATQDLLTAIISDTMDCMVGTCTQSVTTNAVMYAANPVRARQIQRLLRYELMELLDTTKDVLNDQLKMSTTDVDMFCPETPNQRPPLMDDLIVRIQEMLGIGSSKRDNLGAVMGVLFQQPEVLQEASTADGSLCRFFTRNTKTTFDGADLKPFMKLLIYGALEAMGLGSNFDLATAINLGGLAGKGKMMIIEALEAPLCVGYCKVPDLPFTTSNSQSKYIQSGTVTFTCASGYFTPQTAVRTCANGKFNYPFDVDPLQCFRKDEYSTSMMKQRLNNLLIANKQAGVFDDSVTLGEVTQHHQQNVPLAQKVSSRASAKTSIISVIFGCFFVILFAQLMLSPE